MVKIGVLSDTHAHSSEDLPEELLQGLRGADLILHAGDLVNLSVLERLKEITPQVKAVWGNMDPPEVKAALPEREYYYGLEEIDIRGKGTLSTECYFFSTAEIFTASPFSEGVGCFISSSRL